MHLTIGIIALAAYGPLLSVYFSKLWVLPHYQFFPFALFCSGLIAHRDRVFCPTATAAPSFGATATIAIGLSSLFVAVALESPWIAYLSLLTVGTGWALSLTTGWTRVLPTLLMAATVLRLPLSADVWLIQSLQPITATVASRLLDGLGVLHVLSGSVVEVLDARLLVEDACSGVSSLFSAMACTLFYVLWSRHPFFPAALLLTSVPFWVVAANIARVTLVAVLRAEFSIHADTGLLHDALGLLVFAVSMGLILSTDGLIRLASVPDKQAAVPPLTPAASPIRMASLKWFAVGLAAAAAVQIPHGWANYRDAAAPFQSLNLPEFGRTRLGEAFPLGKLVGYEQVRRTARSRLGEHSQVWTFASPQFKTTVSVDSPYVGWHELTECFEMQGWKAVGREVETSIHSTSSPLVRVTLLNSQLSKHGVLLFGLFDKTSRPVAPPRHQEFRELQSRLATGVSRLFTTEDSQVGESLNYQLLVFVESYLPISAAEVEASRSLFHTADASIRGALSEPLGGAAP